MKKLNVGETIGRPYFEETAEYNVGAGLVSAHEKNKGITLIALIITIIVMLILVAVSIQVALNTGLFDAAGKATQNWEIEQEKEEQLGNGQVTIGNTTYNSIEEYMKKRDEYVGLIITTDTEGVTYTDKDGNAKELTEAVEDGDIVQYGDYEYRYNEYFIDFDNGDYWFTDWTEDAEQNGWGVRVLDDTKENYGEICGTILDYEVNTASYAFFQCINLKEMPEIPNTITNMWSSFLACSALEKTSKIPDSVINMNSTFMNCTSLKEPPVLPDGLLYMEAIFSKCVNLVYPPVIPAGVTSLYNSFNNCEQLIEAPEIPSGVENMMRTFAGCESLTTAPVIPESVKQLSYAFGWCTGLTGEVEINARMISGESGSYTDMFSGTVLPIVIYGDCPYLETIVQRASNGNVTIKE